MFTEQSVLDLQLVPVVAIANYFAFFGIGYGPIPWFYIDEIMPEESKKWGNSLIICQNWLMSFIVAKSFMPISELVGFGVTFGFFTIMCSIGVVFCYLYVPETKNKSFIEINREVSLLFVKKDVKSYENGAKDLFK